MVTTARLSRLIISKDINKDREAHPSWCYITCPVEILTGMTKFVIGGNVLSTSSIQPSRMLVCLGWN